MTTYSDFIKGLSPTWAHGFWGSRFIGLCNKITADIIVNAYGQALAASWLFRGGTQPAEALPLLGYERNMPRYPIETNQQYRDRLQGAWEAWEYAGHESAVEAQFDAAGFVGAEVYEPKRTHAVTGNTHGDWLRAPLGYWSQFWLFFPKGTHNFGPPLTIGTAGLTIGGNIVIGTDASYDDVRLVRGIVNKWRPAHVICRELLFEIDGETIGTGHFIDEAGLTIGGSGVSIGGL